MHSILHTQYGLSNKSCQRLKKSDFHFYGHSGVTINILPKSHIFCFVVDLTVDVQSAFSFTRAVGCARNFQTTENEQNVYLRHRITGSCRFRELQISFRTQLPTTLHDTPGSEHLFKMSFNAIQRRNIFQKSSEY